MPIITLANLVYTIGTRVLLDGAVGAIEPSEKIGLVGRNGCGKSTLLKIIAGKLQPDSGSVQIGRGTSIGYLEQDPKVPTEGTLFEAAMDAFADRDRLQVELEHVYELMAHAEGDELERLMTRQAHLDEALERAGGYAVEHRVEAMLHGLGFTDEDFTLPAAGLSGGQRARLGLTRLLLSEPDVLLLDEPTNHLDIAGREWLEEFLDTEFPGAVILVSHDRWLLDKVVHRILEIDRGVICEYPGNYKAFRALRAERRLAQERVLGKQQDKIRSEQAYILKYKAGQRARQAKGRETRLERFIDQNVQEIAPEMGSMALQLPTPPELGDFAFVAEGLSKAYGDRVLFNDLTLAAKPGDRIGIIGPNGAGKTTLVRAILGDLLPDAGTVKLSPRLETGWFRQSHAHLDRMLKVYEYLQSTIRSLEGGPRPSEQEARNLAGAFMFSGSEQEKLVGDLSGGEKARLVLASLVASSKNLLILDEPTNHLDIPSAERLEEALTGFGEGRERTGVVILISHDRALLEQVCQKLLILDGFGNATVFEGRYSEYARRQKELAAKLASAANASKKAPVKVVAAAAVVAPIAARPAAVVANATKNRASKAPREKGPYQAVSQEKLESRLAELPLEIEGIDLAFGNGAIASDPAKSRALSAQREKLRIELVELEAEWMRRAE